MSTTSRRSFLAAAGALLLGACARGARRAAGRAPATGQPTTTPTRATPSTTATAAATNAPANFVRSGPANSGAVALTFHGSGDLALLRRLLDAARSAGAPITVFAVGQWLDENPGVARLILDGGHELANHTYTHPVLPRVPRAGIATEITGCRDALARHTGAPGRWFRPSGTPTPTAVIREEAGRAGYATVVGYDVDPLDYQDPGADKVARAVSAGLHPGAIVSLHTGHAGTVDAFERIAGAIADRKLRAVTVSGLLQAVAG